MKILIVYDSAFGNTKQVAEAMADALKSKAEVNLIFVKDFSAADLDGIALLIAGSPTQKFTMLPAMKQCLNSLPSNALKGLNVAAFDTRITEEEVNRIKILKFFVTIFGYAAEKIGKKLEKKGGRLLSAPKAFYVGGTEGPLLEKELEKAAQWAKSLLEK